MQAYTTYTGEMPLQAAAFNMSYVFIKPFRLQQIIICFTLVLHYHCHSNPVPPGIDLSTPSDLLTVEPGREVSVRCTSEGRYSGVVSWHILSSDGELGLHSLQLKS